MKISNWVVISCTVPPPIFYQPVSQLPKIKAGVDYSKTELHIAEIEQVKAATQIKQTAEKLYFGLLILQKSERKRLKLNYRWPKKLIDVQSAVLAGKILYPTK